VKCRDLPSSSASIQSSSICLARQYTEVEQLKARLQEYEQQQQSKEKKAEGLKNDEGVCQAWDKPRVFFDSPYCSFLPLV
jgi:hypothetical protein